MRDLQSERDYRNIEIDRVGVKGLRYPITVLDRAHKEQPTVASINLFISLPHHFRGTHMSRFVEILNEYRWRIHVARVRDILKKVKERIPALAAHVEISFPYFMEKDAPLSGEKSVMGYDCHLLATLDAQEVYDLRVGVEVPITSVCPCSKEISERGAHSQRGIVKLFVRFRRMVWLEELIEIAESCGSARIYPLLKREDEKFITEWAYDHPVFVEDVVREVSLKLQEDERITWFSVEVENQESIHQHNAYAAVVRERRGKSWVASE